MSSVTTGISVLNEYDDCIWFTHTCSCGCGQQATIEVGTSTKVGPIFLEMYTEVDAFNSTWRGNIISQFFSDLCWRTTTIFKVLFTGTISAQAGILIESKSGIDDYITALTEASNKLKEVNNE